MTGEGIYQLIAPKPLVVNATVATVKNLNVNLIVNDVVSNITAKATYAAKHHAMHNASLLHAKMNV